MLTRIRIAIAVGAFCALCASTAYANPPTVHNPRGGVLGVVPARTLGTSSTSNNLLYHNGPVLLANKVYAIYWIPSGYSVSSNYVSLINGFFSNVAAASDNSSNVYYSDTQYYDIVNSLTSNISGNSTFGGSVVDTDPFPPNGCRDKYTAVCLTDSQLRTEISHELNANGWSSTLGSSNTSPGNEYFLLTPKNVGSCYGRGSCAFSSYCAYHSWIGSGSTATLYANMPYAAWVPQACGSGQSPNGDNADSTINVVSHEHNESNTDPLGTAWYNTSGYEDGDLCAWNFGTPISSTASGEYNQVIHGGYYYLQQEWSNHSSACVLTGW